MLGTATVATLHAISSALLNKDERRSPGAIQWLSLDATIAPLSTRQQLQVAGDAIAQIAQIVQQRSLLTFEEINSMMQDEGPVVRADFFDKFIRQSMHVDFAQFVEPPPQGKRILSIRAISSQ